MRLSFPGLSRQNVGLQAVNLATVIRSPIIVDELLLLGRVLCRLVTLLPFIRKRTAAEIGREIRG